MSANTFVLSGMMLSFSEHVHASLSHISERFEALALIMLGESVTAVCQSVEITKDTETKYYTAVVMGFWLMFLVKLFHFDVEPYVT